MELRPFIIFGVILIVGLLATAYLSSIGILETKESLRSKIALENKKLSELTTDYDAKRTSITYKISLYEERLQKLTKS